MLRSTFLGFKTATSALTVSQNQMDIVGQNISNVNTKGYTRQRVDINSVSFRTNNLKYGLTGVVIGQGVEATGVSQYRDSFLDLRYRTESSKVGSQEVQLSALSDLEAVFDEITTDGLDAQFSDLLEQLHSLTSSPSDPVLEGVVRTSAEMLTQMFNNYSSQIQTIKDQQQTYLKDGAIEKVNQLLDNIAELNSQIKADNISGNPALELNDKRNMLIDELSSYLDIETEVVPLDIGAGRKIDELVIKLKLSDNNMVNIVDRDKYAEFSSDLDSTSDDVKVELTKNIDDDYTNTNLTDLIDKGQIAGYIKFINGKGDFTDKTDVDSQTKGIQYYQKMLDTVANKFATEMNLLNGADKPLFDKRSGTEITAGNIKISDGWADSTNSYILNTTVITSGDKTGATDNILRMIAKFQEKMDFTTDTGKALFKGSFQEFLSFTTTRLNLQVSDVETSYETYSETQFQIEYSRNSLSSVDLNEEGVNLLTYSKSYNAAARLMTTIDEMLDTLINQMAR
ncbi:MAG: flagellar hook-associated protein FlgK [Sedimentibacter saalensis]|jgi:flagellar hook-associated protein 1 FlgK|uniref:flagellar hook-associated protein FlgK n=1 Tax=Sedimentibacter saalensis TaxID=130788 RepID=UPI002B21941B|nr:flagellar hook-associated protein FlgK [Sedimentibacter saalensis]MEA5095200.1 flagellar hook-associated protein FlgK [Sedimentibacter saalensis]